MNRTALGTILGAALLGLAKSKGSSARRSGFDEVFKKRVGNQDQTFKIYLKANYPAIVDDDVPSGSEIPISADFSKKVEDYIEYIKNIIEGFRGFLESGIVDTNGESYWYLNEVNQQDEDWMENIDLYSEDDIFDHWASEEGLVWNDKSQNGRYFLDWEEDYILLSKSKIHFPGGFPQDTSDYDIMDGIRETHVEEMRTIINDGSLDESIEEWTVESFVNRLYEEESVGRYEWKADWSSNWMDDRNFMNLLPDISVNEKSELLNLLGGWEWDLYQPDGGMIDWDDYTYKDVEIVLECRLDLETMQVSLHEWHRFIHRIISSAYEEWSTDHGVRNQTIHIHSIPVIRVTPNIWENKKTSNLRKR
jgi:hypothetical protein